MRRKLLSAVLATVLTAGLGLPIAAQHTSAGVDGTVTDATGSVLPDAEVALTNVDTNVAAHAKTNKSGYFAFVNVNPGSYTMTISKRGPTSAAMVMARMSAGNAIIRSVARIRMLPTMDEKPPYEASMTACGGCVGCR